MASTGKKVSDIASVATHRLGDNALLRANVSQKDRPLDFRCEKDARFRGRLPYPLVWVRLP